MGKVYTIGYQRHDINTFIDELKGHDVSVVIDVRGYPRSRRRCFSKHQLKKALKSEGIDYIHLKALGVPYVMRMKYKDTRDLAQLFEEYSYCLARAQDQLEVIKTLSKSFNVCLMCYEEDPMECHRYVIAEELKKDGCSVEHIISESKEEENLREEVVEIEGQTH